MYIMNTFYNASYINAFTKKLLEKKILILAKNTKNISIFIAYKTLSFRKF